ncbi:MAG: DUF6754 domain-containing protein [Candidatus Zixiibacteriota bacterium]
MPVAAVVPPDSARTVDPLGIVPVAPVTSLMVSDFKYDDGEALELTWVPSIDDLPVGGKVTGYQIYRSVNGGEAVRVTEVVPGVSYYKDEDLCRDSTYVYQILTIARSSQSPSIATEAIKPQREWVNLNLKYLFLISLIITGAVIYFIETAKRKKLFVRKIAGLEAVDEAIGRATEMGRSILFIPGIHDMDDVQTLAAITILGRVSRVVADYDTKIRMPVARSLVMTAARETIKSAYLTAGRPDAYNDDMVNYVTDEQFGYVAAVDGIMVRERPATIFLLGAFFAESLILAETGNSVGAIQIAGTARPAQLPFFIAACDFTLIGEELFAASAYLSGEPKQLGSLKGQDVGKALAMLAILTGVLLATMAAVGDVDAINNILDFLTKVFSVAG